MVRPRTALAALLPFVAHGLAREADGAIGLLLRSTLDLPDFAATALHLLGRGDLFRSLAGWAAAGIVAWVGLAALRARFVPQGSFREALEAEAAAFGPLWLRPALTLITLFSLLIRPSFPYGFTLPVALTQDWGPAQDLAAFATLVALRYPGLRSEGRLSAEQLRLPGFRLPSPGPGGIFFIAFLGYALLSPPWSRTWDGHPGNEPKYLRMAIALGHEATLDVEDVSGPMEELTPQPLLSALGGAVRGMASESGRMIRALAQGPQAVGAGAIRASRITRQTIRGKEGGVYHVLAPGPSFLLAPTLRLDRALNRALGTPGRVALTLLAWNALAAALVAAVFLLARDASGRPGLSALLAAAFAFVPPYVFYFFQFYPEMLGALVLALALRLLLFRNRWNMGDAVVLGLLLATLPWLHQKFLPVWGVLVVMATVRVVDRLSTLRALLGLLVPQAAGLFLFALYNFAITGSARPDALFLAWGPGGVSSARVGQGLLGLLLDARYGLLPYAPAYLLATGALLAATRGAGRLRWALVPGAVYYLTVAAADNWSGAICNLGRYVMPVTPVFVAFAAVALARTEGQRGVRALALILFSWTGILASALWRDPHAANDSALLLAKSAFADGNLYVPNLFLRTWSDAAPGLGLRIGIWLALAGFLGFRFMRAARPAAREDSSGSRPVGGSPLAVLFGLVAIVLAAGFLMERYPPDRTAPRFSDGLGVSPGVVVFAPGAHVVDDAFRVGGGVDLLVRSRAPLDSLSLVVGGQGLLRLPGRAPLILSSSGARVLVTLDLVVALTGRRGAREWLYRQRLDLDPSAEAVLRFGD